MVPLWGEGDTSSPNKFTASPAAASAAGLHPRSLAQTIADIQAENRDPFRGPPGVGIRPEREAEILARRAIP
jgi:hypothetical protein